jgi:hypothetical protein
MHPMLEHNKSSAEDVSYERAIDTFTQGLRRADFVKELGRTKPKTMAELMDVANRFADGEDAYQNKRTRTPKDDRLNRYNNQRRRSRNYDNYGSHSQVAAGYKENNYQSDDRQNSGYRNNSRDDNNMHYRPRSSREYNQSLEDMLNGPCHMHYTNIHGKRVSRHAMKDCRTLLKLQEAVGFKQAKAKKSRLRRSQEQHDTSKSATH